MDGAAIDWLTETVLHALARDEPITPAALSLLLRQYVATGRDDVSDALGGALARGLEAAPTEGDSGRRAEWLSLFVEAAALSEDERLCSSAGALVSALCSEWPAHGGVEPAMHAVDACLTAAGVLPDLLNAPVLVPAAIDELERIVRVVYRPGEGIAHTLSDPDARRGELRDQVAMASALLMAHEITGRLPYSMLAEELMQFARHDLEPATWSLGPGNGSLEHFLGICDAARVLCRLARLHDDAAYLKAAVTAVSPDYAGDARRALAALSPAYRDHGIASAVYGLALFEQQGLR